MSWFIERLLRNTEKIHGSLDVSSEIRDHLLTLESTISTLIKDSDLTEEELNILERLQGNPTITTMAKDMGLSRFTLVEKIERLVKKLAFILGGIYTDEGYLDYFQIKHKLSDDEIQAVRDKITGQYKRFYMS